MPSKGFSVDNWSRNDVIAFWHAIYMASEGYQNRNGWTGSHTATDHNLGTGTISEVFVRDVERRLNFFRALCGAPSTASLNTGSTVVIQESDPHKPSNTTLKSAANQRAAYMIARSYIISDEADGADHDPPSNTIAWTTAAWNSNARSNLTYGYYGPGAIDAYMNENDAGTTMSDNSTVRHRRWGLYQSATDYATGDTPGKYVPGQTRVWASTNSLYVWQKPSELAEVTPRFVTYPAAGYFPAPLNTRYWSVSHPNANFSGATVVMRTAAGATASTTKITAASTGGPGDSSLVWQVNSSTHYSTEAPVDRTYTITVTGITGTGVPSSLTYSVTLIDPDNFQADQSLTGTEAPPSASPASYFITRPKDSDAVSVDVFTNSSSPWKETAETGAETTVINRLYTSSDPANPYTPYTFLTTAISPMTAVNATAGNTRMFRLTHPVRWDILTEGVPNEIFELDREILTIPSQISKLKFGYKRGYMTVNSRLVIEYTQDNGATWTSLGNPIVGASPFNGAGVITGVSDTSTQSWEGTFPQSAEPYRVRFRYFRQNTSGTTIAVHTENPSAATGIFIDDIISENCTWFDLEKSNELSSDANRFVFNTTSAGETAPSLANGSQYLLRMRTKLGGKWFQYGPAKSVTVTDTPITGFGGWFAYEYPTLSGGFSGDDDGDGIPNAIEYAFFLDPLSPGSSPDTVAISTSLARSDEPSVSISRPIPEMRTGIDYTAEWSDTLETDSWSSEGVTVTHADGVITATAPAGSGSRFIRWKVTSP